MKKTSNYEKNLYILLGIIASLFLIVYAAASYQVANGDTDTIDEHGTCKQITNNHAEGLDIFIPTTTSGEWQAFYDNKPTGVTESSCVSYLYNNVHTYSECTAISGSTVYDTGSAVICRLNIADTTSTSPSCPSGWTKYSSYKQEKFG